MILVNHNNDRWLWGCLSLLCVLCASCQQGDLRDHPSDKLSILVETSDSDDATVKKEGEISVDLKSYEDLSDIKICPGGTCENEITSENPPTSGRVTVNHSYNFRQGSQQQLDVIWMIDNSGSMEDNIDGVVRNFAEFVRSVSQMSMNARVYLITCVNGHSSGSGTVIHPETGYTSAIHCIDYNETTYKNVVVYSRAWKYSSSYSIPLILANRATQSSVDPGPDSLYKKLKVRPNSKKVFVAVSDEMAAYTFETPGYPSVIDKLDRAFGKQNVSFFSFSSPRPKVQDIISSPKGNDLQKATTKARIWLPQAEAFFTGRSGSLSPIYLYHNQCGEMSYSQVYELLAQYYGSRAYSLCVQNWRQNFKNLTLGIEKAVIEPLSLTQLSGRRNLTIDQVKIGSTVLRKNTDYTISGSSPPLLKIIKEGVSGNVVVSATYDR